MNPFAFVRDLFRWYRLATQSKRLKKKEEETSYVPWVVANNGHVVVQEDAFKDRTVTNLSVAGMSLSPEVEYMLSKMSAKDLYDLQLWMCFTEDSEDPEKLKTLQDIKRGLSIGSAIFGYQIPQSSVLIDRRTRLLYTLFLWNYTERQTFYGWLEKEQQLYSANHALITDVEKTKLQVNMFDLVTFYNKHSVYLINYILQCANEKIAPHINGFVRSIMTKLNLPTDNDNQIHYVRCCISAIAANLQVQVPAGWVMNSEMVDNLQDAIYGVDTKPQLRLVVDNSLYESKPL